jgi:hypothetical protein
LLVDNARLNRFGGEIKLRSDIESRISKYKFNSKDKRENIPIVVIVVGKKSVKKMVNSQKKREKTEKSVLKKH